MAHCGGRGGLHEFVHTGDASHISEKVMTTMLVVVVVVMTM